MNGQEVATGRVPVSAALAFTANDCLDIGTDLGSPVSVDYYDKAPFNFNGKIDQVYVKYTGGTKYLILPTGDLLKPRSRASVHRVSCWRATPRLCIAALFIVAGSLVPRAAGQQIGTEFWPEVDTYVNLNNSMRIFFMAARTKDLESRTVSGEFGANLDLYLKSIRGRHLESADQSKRKYLMLRVGYRALPQIDHTVEHGVSLNSRPATTCRNPS